LADDPDGAWAMGLAAREFVVKRFHRQDLAEQFKRLVEKLAVTARH